MSLLTSGTASRLPNDLIEPILGAPAVLAESLIQAQRLQLDTLLALQRSAIALQQELWDEWVCRFGGGAPIDI